MIKKYGNYYMKKKMKKVLLLDDSLTLRKGLAMDLAKEGFEVIEAASGSDLLDAKTFDPSIATTGLLDRVIPDIFILDIELPDMNGVDILKRLKQHRIFKDIPAVVISSHRDKNTITNAISAGAMDYVVKTGNFGPTLVAKVRRTFEKELSSFDTTIQSEFEWIKFGKKEMALAYITIRNSTDDSPLSSREFVDLVICLQRGTKHYDWIFTLDDYNVAIVLPLVTIQHIIGIKDRLHEEIQTFIKDIKIPVDVQIGFSHYPTNATTVQELISVAEGQISRVNSKSA